MVQEFYLNKSITITGCNGFVGKTYLEKILFEIEGFKKINLFLRKQKSASIEKRFIEEIAKSIVFNRLKEKIQKFDDEFTAWLLQRIDLYEVDYNKKNLNLSEENISKIFSEKNVFVHIAASVNWDDPMDTCLNNNLLSTINLLKMINNHQNQKSDFVYLSSALIFGKVLGECYETFLGEHCTTDEDFNHHIEEFKVIPIDYWFFISKHKRRIFNLKAKKKIQDPCPYECIIHPEESVFNQLLEKMRYDWVNKNMVEYGRKIAHSYQFSDMYTFTKALCELEVMKNGDTINISIVRSSAITAAIQDPFPGWIEKMISYNPLILKIGQGKLKIMPAQKKAVLDFIPVDLIINQLILAPLHILIPNGQQVFNVANSSIVHHTVMNVINNIVHYFNLNNIKKHHQNRPPKLVAYIIHPKIVLTILHLQRLIVLGSIDILYFFNKIHFFLKFQKKLVYVRRDLLKKIRILELYKVYLEGGKWTILANTSDDYKKYLPPNETQHFNTNIKDATPWENYWENIHIAGMFKFMLK